MKVSDFWVLSCKNMMFEHLSWCISSFSVTRSPEGWVSEDATPLVPYYEDGYPHVVDLDGIVHKIEVGKNKPIFEIHGEVVLSPGVLANVKKEVKTTYGIALLNAIWFTSYAGDKIEYINGELNPTDIVKMYAEMVEKGTLEVAEAMGCGKAMNWSTGLSQIAVPSATMKSLIPNKKVLKLKKELLAKHKDNLDDPTVMAEIEDKIAKLDKEELKGDPSEIFYKSNKAYKNTRKEMMYMAGAESTLEDENKQVLNPVSLQDGIDLDYFPAQVNSSRMGSYNRGSLTALGGEIVKFLLRVFQKTSIAEEDCGTKLGWEVTVTRLNSHILGGRYQAVNGKPVAIEQKDIKGLMGKTILLRSPGYCKTGNNNFCSKCMGDRVSRNKNAIPMLALEVGSRIMDIYMAKMHVGGISTTEYDYLTHIR